MGGEQSLALPPGKGPHGVGCVDVMVGHTRQGLFLRLFYPCEPRVGAERPRWIPRYEYSRGLAQFRGRSPRWGAPLLHVAFGSCRVPVSWKGPFKPRSGGYPLVIFSHGLGAFRTLYSSVCSELASWGFVVAALEHRDGSASATYFCTAESGQEEWIQHQRLPPGQKEFYFRNMQVHQRANECVRALRLFQAVRGGRPVPNVLHPDFDLSVLKDGVDLGKVAVMGHSFGGVTAVLALVKEPSFRCAVALDAWMFPLENTLYPEVPRPVLFINAEKFQTPESIAKMKRLSSRNSQTRIITVLGSVHHSQTDFAFLTGKLVRRIFSVGGTLDPHKGLDIISRAALAFLQRHLDLKEDFDRWEHLLDGVGDSVVPAAPPCRSNL
nr:platelet-activating factor acetylhydrolase 2, cytoplasmic [Anas platyrhynchos]XP_038023126.1 platelet-activating factor acetylhydrolase 2, cytoplasmic [Anas platyrhynchos]XP_038023127.1 platelet-activating factor acetylhydrolase 2, cytoplasmic [Anas platyrhynchos]XP_038023128.1 platelet-activating factor acetylhydrolase 2, cytoplasmic [Anas platyrhynchos]